MVDHRRLQQRVTSMSSTGREDGGASRSHGSDGIDRAGSHDRLAGALIGCYVRPAGNTRASPLPHSLSGRGDL